jgi:hypothetical protein
MSVRESDEVEMNVAKGRLIVTLRPRETIIWLIWWRRFAQAICTRKSSDGEGSRTAALPAGGAIPH